MTIAQRFVASSNLTNDAVRTRAVGALSLILAKAALMVAMLAHEVHAGQVKLTRAGRAARKLKDARRIGVR